jgi:hypothetical protein
MKNNRRKNLINLIKITNCFTTLVNYFKFVKLRIRGSFNLNKDFILKNTIYYYEYTTLRRNSKMKVVVHFKEDGLNLQKLIEELLLECCSS